jgi:ribosomal RNA-processing protein 36
MIRHADLLLRFVDLSCRSQQHQSAALVSSMSAAFQVRKPFVSKSSKSYNNLSRSAGAFKQPEANNPRQFQAKRHSYSQQNQNKKRKQSDPLFAAQDEGAAADSSRPYKHQRSSASPRDFKPRNSQSFKGRDNFKNSERNGPRGPVDEAGESESEAVEDSSPAAQIAKQSASQSSAGKEGSSDSNSDQESIDNEAISADYSGTADNDDSAMHQSTQPKKKKRGKNAPLEVSSKIPASRYQQVVKERLFKPVDPRFIGETGEYKEGQFRQAYSFLDNYKEDEINSMQNFIKKNRNNNKLAEQVEETKQTLAKSKQELQLTARRDRERSVLSQWKKKEFQAQAHGKSKFYLKDSAVKQMKMAQNYLALKASGKLDEKLEQRRKQNAAKDHRYMPRQQ